MRLDWVGCDAYGSSDRAGAIELSSGSRFYLLDMIELQIPLIPMGILLVEWLFLGLRFDWFCLSRTH